MIKLLKYEADHLLKMNVQPGQAEMIGEIDAAYAASLENGGVGLTGIRDDGMIIACGGIVEQWRGRWLFWAVLSVEARNHMVFLTRATRRFVALQCPGRRRTEAIVRTGFEEGHRWVKLIGLQFHHHEEKFLPGGEDADIYVKFGGA